MFKENLGLENPQQAIKKVTTIELRKREIEDFKKERLMIGTHGEKTSLTEQLEEEREEYARRIREAKAKLEKLKNKLIESCEKADVDARGIDFESEDRSKRDKSFENVKQDLKGLGQGAKKALSLIIIALGEAGRIFEDIEEAVIKDEALAEIQRDAEFQKTSAHINEKIREKMNL